MEKKSATKPLLIFFVVLSRIYGDSRIEVGKPRIGTAKPRIVDTVTRIEMGKPRIESQ